MKTVLRPQTGRRALGYTVSLHLFEYGIVQELLIEKEIGAFQRGKEIALVAPIHGSIDLRQMHAIASARLRNGTHNALPVANVFAVSFHGRGINTGCGLGQSFEPF